MKVPSVIFLFIVLLFSACKSDVQDQSALVARNTLNIDSLKLDTKQAIRESNSQNSVITKKYYSIRACLSDNAMGQKLERRRIEATGSPLRNNITDTGGCIFWEHTFDFDYSGVGRCIVKSKVIKVPNSHIQTTLNYAIDLVTDEITDLSRGKGCTIQEENISANVKNDGGLLILERVRLYWTGLMDVMRSDVRTLDYQTKVESCVRARVNDIPMSNTRIEITIHDKSGLHEDIKLPALTDNNGCFSTQYVSPYEQFKYSHWLEKDFTIEVISGPLQGERTGTIVYVNPYEPSRLIFAVDSAWDPIPEDNPMPVNNRIHIDGVMYVQIGNDQNEFKVNDYLGLTVAKSYQVVLHPRLDLGHRFQKDKPRYTKMHDGKFRLKFMLLAPNKADIDINENNFNDYTYITGAEKIVTLRDGVINSRMNIPVRLTDLPRLATRAMTVFKLEPLEDTGLRETLVTGYFKAKIAWIKTNVFQSDVLQDEQDTLEDNYLSHLPKGKRDQILEERKKGSKEYTDGLIAQERLNLDLSKEAEDDLNKLEYKRFIENLFAGIDPYKINTIYGNPKIFEEDSAKGIFVRHLTHTYPGIKIARTNYQSDDPFVEELINEEIDLPKGLINGLHTKDKTNKLNKKEDRHYKALMAKLCRLSFPKPEKSDSFLSGILGAKENMDFTRCKNNPETFFDSKFIMHSHKVYGSRPKNSNGLRIHVGSRFSTQSSEAETEYLSKRVGADAAIKLPFGEFFGMGIRLFDVSYTWSESESYNQSNSDDVGFSKEIIGESFTIEVDALMEKCVLVRGKEYLPYSASLNMGIASGGLAGGVLLPRQMQQFNKKLTSNYYLCDEPEKTTFDENWYYIQDYVPSATLLRDAYGPTEIKLIKVFRGQSTLNELKKIFEDETKVYLATRTSNSETPDIKLYENWGHLLKNPKAPAVANKLLINNFEGSFPGTVQ